MIKSLELNWISKNAKGLVDPLILFAPKLKNCSGCYYLPCDQEFLLFGKFYDLSNGMIVVEERNDIRDVANTIAHEWRHHWQWFNTVHKTPQIFNHRINYKKAIKNFFKHSDELDALLFSHKIAPSLVSEYWLEIIGGTHVTNAKNSFHFINSTM